MSTLKKSSSLYRGLDSFKLLIPFDRCEVLYKVTALVQSVYLSTGELYGEAKTQPYTHKQMGVDTHYGIVKLFGSSFVYILVNSKLLKQHYFHSINAITRDFIYQEIIKQRVVNVDYDVFLDSILTDIDVKSDFEMHTKEFYNFCAVRKKEFVYPKFYSSRPNIGLEYVKRHSATPSQPYVKYYSKHAELFGRSNKFRSCYLSDFYNEELRRCEVTVKNHEHKKYMSRHLWEMPNTLRDWTSLSQNDYREIVLHCVNRHEENNELKPRDTYSINVSELKRMDYFLFKIYIELKKNNYTDKEILGLYDMREGKTKNTHYAEKSILNTKLEFIRSHVHKTDKKLISKPFL